jgi:hypothetical protein
LFCSRFPDKIYEITHPDMCALGDGNISGSLITLNERKGIVS